MPKQMDPRLAYDDPLLASRDFFYSITLFPLGFPLTVESNSQDILQAARASWSYFPQTFDREPVISFAWRIGNSFRRLTTCSQLSVARPSVCRSFPTLKIFSFAILLPAISLDG